MSSKGQSNRSPCRWAILVRWAKKALRLAARPVCHLRNYDQAFDVCSLGCVRVCVRPSELAGECLAAAGTHPGADLAGGRAGCAACPGAGVCYERVVAWRRIMDRGM